MYSLLSFFFFLSGAAETAAEHGESAGGHAHQPWFAEQIYHALHLTPEQLPPNIIHALISALICIVGLKLLIGKPSVDKPSAGQQMVEVVVLQVRSMLEQGIGAYGFKYLSFLLPLTFFVLISNLMGLIPIFEPPTNKLSTTLALGLCSFCYYIYMGFSQQGVVYLKHFTAGLTSGIFAIIGILIFFVEIFSNSLRPITLGVRLMINMFADEQVLDGFGAIVPVVIPSALLVLGTFVCFVQTFIFIQLSIVYLGETVPHDDHHDEEHGHEEHGHEDGKLAHAH